MSEPMFSVVIPLYNKSPHIIGTLQSVLAQTLPPDEIIVVDDGSTDGGAEAVEQFVPHGVRLIRQVNSGVSAARNEGVRHATARYIAFIDADDKWLPFHLETLQGLIAKFPGLGLYSTFYEIRMNRRVFKPHCAYPPHFAGPVDDFFARMAVGLSLVISSTACVARQALLDIGGFPREMKRGEDIVVWLKLYAAAGMAHTATITAIYNRDAVNRSTSLRESQAPGSLLYLRELLAGGTLTGRRVASARRLFKRIAFFTAAGMREAGDIGGVEAIRRLAADEKMFLLQAKIWSLTMTPPFILTFARRFRHRESSTLSMVAAAAD